MPKQKGSPSSQPIPVFECEFCQDLTTDNSQPCRECGASLFIEIGCVDQDMAEINMFKRDVYVNKFADSTLKPID